MLINQLRNTMNLKLKTLITIILFTFCRKVNAQWVTIPDPDFATYLQVNFPSCMSGNMMDTTCNDVVTAAIVDCNFLGIHSIEGIQYFDALGALSCAGDSLTSIPDLPTTLSFLIVTGNAITSINSLPPNLQSFYCENNLLNTLPALPPSLIRLFCSGNQLTSLPALPTSLIELDCSRNLLSSLPSFGNLITDLNCSFNQITALPALPTSLLNLLCSHNQLNILPSFPNGMQYLDASFNQLSMLPVLSDSLNYLNCNFNQLAALPTLPPSLSNLRVRSNLLTSIPELPLQLKYLDCSSNQISCLPVLPVSLINPAWLSLTFNLFNCLPNYVPAMTSSAYLNYSLCFNNDSITNPDSCNAYKGLLGHVYKDGNTNCVLDGSDNLCGNVKLNLYDSAGTLLSSFFSLSNGIYGFNLDSGNYTVSLDTNYSTYYTPVCTHPGVDSTFTLTTSAPVAENINFDIACTPGFDVGVKSVNTDGLVFPGQLHDVYILAGDLSKWYNLNCASGVSGSITVSVTGPITFSNVPATYLTPSLITGNTFTYSIADFGTLDLNSLGLTFRTDTTAATGDLVCVTIEVSPFGADNDTSNNHYLYCYGVSNSFDPNVKEVYPVSVAPGYDGYFVYTVRFQNTGFSPAQNIRVVDSLDNQLNAATFEVINYSHANVTGLNGNEVSFRFPNIQLPDSTTSPEDSKGFIQYRIKPAGFLSIGSSISNKANIYFDFNAPVTTNTVVSTVDSTVGINTISIPRFMAHVFPNPGKGIFNVALTSNGKLDKHLMVVDVMGRKVKQITTNENTFLLDLSLEPNGIYFFKCSDSNNVFIQKIIKE